MGKSGWMLWLVCLSFSHLADARLLPSKLKSAYRSTFGYSFPTHTFIKSSPRRNHLPTSTVALLQLNTPVAPCDTSAPATSHTAERHEGSLCLQNQSKTTAPKYPLISHKHVLHSPMTRTFMKWLQTKQDVPSNGSAMGVRFPKYMKHAMISIPVEIGFPPAIFNALIKIGDLVYRFERLILQSVTFFGTCIALGMVLPKLHLNYHDKHSTRRYILSVMILFIPLLATLLKTY